MAVENLVVPTPTYDSYALHGYTWPHVWSRDSAFVLTFSVPTAADEDELFKVLTEIGPVKRVFRIMDTQYQTEEESGSIVWDMNPGGAQVRGWVSYSAGNEKMFFHLSSIYSCKKLRDIRAYLREHLSPPEKVPEGSIQVSFHYMSDQGADTTRRNIDACKWDDIRRNYSKAAVEKMETLFALKPENMSGGKLAVMHGPPGSGKTHLLRALAREWKEWAEISYIIDVDNFFHHAAYMLEVLLDDPPESKWRVIVCEDAEEYISPDSKRKVGQALAKLLNLGDGMLGQGLNVLMLFTTNAPDSQLHPAITRAGRCFAKIEVPLLNSREATEWLDQPIYEPISLADLYEIKGETSKVEHEAIDNHKIGQYI